MSHNSKNGFMILQNNVYGYRNKAEHLHSVMYLRKRVIFFG